MIGAKPIHEWPTEATEREFRALYPQFPRAGVQIALEVMAADLRRYRQQDAQFRALLDAAIPGWDVKVHEFHRMQRVAPSTFGT